MNTRLGPLSSCYSFQNLSPWNSSAHIQDAYNSDLNYSNLNNSSGMYIGYLDLTHSSLPSPRFVSWITLYLIKLTMLTITCNQIYVVYRVIYQLIDWGLLSTLCAKDESSITVFQKVHLYFIHQTNPLKIILFYQLILALLGLEYSH